MPCPHFFYKDMIKVYEMKGMNACKMSIEHKGVTINLSFENGNVSSKRNARLTTENRFVQDAIEADAHFSLLMGEQPELRRKFIEENAIYATDLDI